MICALCNGRLHSGIFLGLFLRSTAKIIYAFITQCISEDRGHFFIYHCVVHKHKIPRMHRRSLNCLSLCCPQVQCLMKLYPCVVY